MVALAAQEERRGRACHPEPHRNWQLALSRCHPRVLPDKSLSPNPEARNPNTAELYRKFGLSPRQIEIIAEAVPKRHYYYISPLGRRLFELSLEPVTLALVGTSSKEDLLRARRMSRENGENWPARWLQMRGLGEWAEYWEKLRGYGERCEPDFVSLHANGKTH